MDPVEAFLSEFGTTKEAAHPMAQRFGDALTTGAAAAGAATLVAGAGMAVSKAYDALTKGRDFRVMLQHNPDLQEHLDRNPERFNQMYTTLRAMNPAFGKDPLVAGTYMRQMTESPMNAGGIASNVQARPGPSLFQGALDIGSNAGASYYTEHAKQRARGDVNGGTGQHGR